MWITEGECIWNETVAQLVQVALGIVLLGEPASAAQMISVILNSLALSASSSQRLNTTLFSGELGPASCVQRFDSCC